MPDGTPGVDFDPLNYVTRDAFDRLPSNLQERLREESNAYERASITPESEVSLDPWGGTDYPDLVGTATQTSTTTCHPD